MAVRRPKSKNPLSPLDVLNVSGPKKEKAPKAAKAAGAPKAAKTPAVAVEYPQAGETVLPGHYAIRVAAEPEAVVEIAIDGGPWQPCRAAAGYFWFDWSPASGAHTLVARAKNGGPRFAKSAERAVQVIDAPTAA